MEAAQQAKQQREPSKRPRVPISSIKSPVVDHAVSELVRPHTSSSGYKYDGPNWFDLPSTIPQDLNQGSKPKFFPLMSPKSPVEQRAEFFSFQSPEEERRIVDRNVSKLTKSFSVLRPHTSSAAILPNLTARCQDYPQTQQNAAKSAGELPPWWLQYAEEADKFHLLQEPVESAQSGSDLQSNQRDEPSHIPSTDETTRDTLLFRNIQLIEALDTSAILNDRVEIDPNLASASPSYKLSPINPKSIRNAKLLPSFNVPEKTLKEKAHEEQELQKYRRAEKQIVDTVNSGVHSISLNYVTDTGYHLPRTRELDSALSLAIDAQRSALDRNWGVIKRKFVANGSVMSFDELEDAMRELKITEVQIERMLNTLSDLLDGRHNIIEYDDFEYSFSELPYESNSEEEDHLSDGSMDFANEYLTEEERHAKQSARNNKLSRKLHRLRRALTARAVAKNEDPNGLDDALVTLGVSVLFLSELSMSWDRLNGRFRRKRKEELGHRSLHKKKKKYLRRFSAKGEAALKKLEYRKVEECLTSKATAVQRSASRNLMTLMEQASSRKLAASPKASRSPKRPSFLARSPKLLHSKSTRGNQVQVEMVLAIELMRDLAATLIQANARRFIIHKRIVDFKIEVHLSQVYKRRKLAHLRAWKQQILANFEYYGVVRRKFYVWARHVQKLSVKRRVIQVAFWPFYVWKRYTSRRVTATQKAKLLTSVWHTVHMMTHFRAWKRLYRSKRGRLLAALDHRSMCDRLRVVQLLNRWHAWAAKRRLIHALWLKKGRSMRSRNLHRHLDLYIKVWRYYACCKRVVKERLRHFGSYLMPTEDGTALYYQPCWQLPLPHVAFNTANTASRAMFAEMHGYSYYAKKQRSYYGKSLTSYNPAGQEEDLYCGIEQQVKHTKARFLAKESRHSKAVYFRFTKLAGCFFDRWCGYVEYCQKKRFTWHFMSTKLLTKVFAGWMKRVEIARNIRRRRDNSDYVSKVAERILRDKELLRQQVAQEAEQERLQQLAAARAPVLPKRTTTNKSIEEVRQDWERDELWRVNGVKKAAEEIHALKRQRLRRNSVLSGHAKRHSILDVEVRDCEELVERILQEKQREMETSKQVMHRKAELLYNRRAVELHDALCKVIDEIRAEQVQQLVVLAFSRMRFPILVRKSMSMFNRNRIRNWIRICIKIRKLWRAMPRYRELRTKWRVFACWLQLVDRKYLYESPGVRQQIDLRRRQITGFSHLLDTKAVQLPEVDSSTRALFARWVEFVAVRTSRKQVVALFRLRRKYLLLQRVFYSMRTVLKPRYTFAAYRRSNQPYPALSVRYDLERWKTRYLVLERRQFTIWHRKKNQFAIAQARRFAWQTDTLKRRIQAHHKSIPGRILFESRLLFGDFEKRGTVQYEDVGLPVNQHGNPILLGSPHKGEAFSDPVLQTNSAAVSEVNTYVLAGAVVGIQLKFQSPGNSWVNPVRGGTEGKKSMYRLAVASGERLVLIEGFHRKAILKLRYHTSLGRTSPWYGGDTTDAKRFVLGRYIPGTKASSVIIGLRGTATASSLNSIGVTCRSTVDEGLFAHFWKGKSRRDDHIKSSEKVSKFGRAGAVLASSFAFSSTLKKSRAELMQQQGAVSGLSSLVAKAKADEGKQQPAAPVKLQAKGKDNPDKIWARAALKYSIKKDKNLEEMQENADEEGEADHRQFGTLLRMRAADIQEALQRAEGFAVVLSKHPNKFLSCPRVAAGLAFWLFQGLVHGLIPEYDGKGEDFIKHGKMLIEKGVKVTTEGRLWLAEIEGYSWDGKHNVDDSVLGAIKADKIRADITVGESKVKQGEELCSAGNALIQKGNKMMPQLNRCASVRRYYSNLVKLAVMQDSSAAS